jgi:hypothetical protein
MLPTVAAILMLVGGAQGGHTPCTEQEHRRMQEQFTSCRSAHARGHHERGGDICQLLDQVVKGCGEVWQACHAHSEIRTLESMHVEAFREQWRAREAELVSCPLYRNIRSFKNS